MMRGQLAIAPVFLGLLLLSVLLPDGPWGRERVVFAIFVEAALLAIAAPIPTRWWVLPGVLVSGAVATTGVAVVCAPDRIGAVLLAHLVLAPYAGFLQGVALAVGRPLGARAALLGAAALGFGLLLSPLLVDPLLPLASDATTRSEILRWTLVLNPPAAISSSLFGVDWIREGSLYVRTRFASSQPFVYPPWTATMIAFGLLWAVVAGLHRLLAGRRPPPAGGRPSMGRGAPLDSRRMSSLN